MVPWAWCPLSTFCPLTASPPLQAAIRAAVDMVDEGLISEALAVLMVQPGHLDQLLHPQFESDKIDKSQVLGRGIAASPGAAVGQIVFRPADAEAVYSQGLPCILVRRETSGEDMGGIYAAEGVLTVTGGMTSHAAVAARGWGKTCVCGVQVRAARGALGPGPREDRGLLLALPLPE